MYRKILVPVDASPCSVKGLAEALQLASALNARVLLLHVVNELLSDAVLAPTEYRQELIESIRAAGKETLADAHNLAKAQGVQAEDKLIETIGGRASDCIVDAAKSWGADLIVMGTHGRRGMSRLAMGSDAEQVVRSAPVPVLLVRGQIDL
ncbi:universal stress protein [Peristeroidobacter agariperforans]|uniref:universal stress protein n=1 Tax=Peristeroidobacter agariperforans TaxID=268404 RepID=UPI00101CAC25|nr:universal stress protein [Peristeroidobacter agariperforans]